MHINAQTFTCCLLPMEKNQKWSSARRTPLQTLVVSQARTRSVLKETKLNALDRRPLYECSDWFPVFREKNNFVQVNTNGGTGCVIVEEGLVKAFLPVKWRNIRLFSAEFVFSVHTIVHLEQARLFFFHSTCVNSFVCQWYINSGMRTITFTGSKDKWTSPHFMCLPNHSSLMG